MIQETLLPQLCALAPMDFNSAALSGNWVARRFGNAADRPEAYCHRAMKTPPIRAVCAARGRDQGIYFFLPWFLTASIAAAAASGSR